MKRACVAAAMVTSAAPSALGMQFNPHREGCVLVPDAISAGGEKRLECARGQQSRTRGDRAAMPAKKRSVGRLARHV